MGTFTLQVRYQEREWIDRVEKNYRRNGKMFVCLIDWLIDWLMIIYWLEKFREESGSCVPKRQALSRCYTLPLMYNDWQSHCSDHSAALVPWRRGMGGREGNSVLIETTMAGSSSCGEGSRWVWYGNIKTRYLSDSQVQLGKMGKWRGGLFSSYTGEGYALHDFPTSCKEN